MKTGMKEINTHDVVIAAVIALDDTIDKSMTTLTAFEAVKII